MPISSSGKDVLTWIHSNVLERVPALYLEELEGLAGMIACEADAVKEHATVPHASDNPLGSLRLFITMASEFAASLQAEANLLTSMAESAERLSRTAEFTGVLTVRDDEPVPVEEGPADDE